MSEAKTPEPDEERIKTILEERNPRRLSRDGMKIAAVLAPIFMKDGGWHLLLTRRTDTVEHHKGEISFPGGHMDEDDPDLEHTALRETHEEVGIPPGDVNLLGRLDDINTITDFRVRPFVGRLDYPFEVYPCEDEIAEVIMLPVSEFLVPCNATKSITQWKGTEHAIYFFHVGGHTVWGATAKILKQLLELCFGFKEPGMEI